MMVPYLVRTRFVEAFNLPLDISLCCARAGELLDRQQWAEVMGASAA